MPYSYYTWTVSEVVSYDDMNTYLRDNLEYIYNPPTDINEFSVTGSSLTTTSASFTDVNDIFVGTVYPSNASGTCTLLVTAQFTARPNTTTTVQVTRFDLMLNGTSVTSGTGIASVSGGNTVTPVGIAYWLDEVPTGTAVVKLRWRTDGGTASIMGGGSTIGGVAQFAVREVS